MRIICGILCAMCILFASCSKRINLERNYYKFSELDGELISGEILIKDKMRYYLIITDKNNAKIAANEEIKILSKSEAGRKFEIYHFQINKMFICSWGNPCHEQRKSLAIKIPMDSKITGTNARLILESVVEKSFGEYWFYLLELSP